MCKYRHQHHHARHLLDHYLSEPRLWCNLVQLHHIAALDFVTFWCSMFAPASYYYCAGFFINVMLKINHQWSDFIFLSRHKSIHDGTSESVTWQWFGDLWDCDTIALIFFVIHFLSQHQQITFNTTGCRLHFERLTQPPLNRHLYPPTHLSTPLSAPLPSTKQQDSNTYTDRAFLFWQKIV